jgi:outer membrane protein assembly factor BamB
MNAGGYIEAHFKAVTGIRSSPIVINDKVYVGSLDTNLYCLDANSGDIIWTFKTEGYITSSAAFSDGSIYITSQEPNSGALYKLDADNGSLVWKNEMEYVLVADRGTDIHVSPTVADGMVFAATNKDYYYGINSTTGETEWTYLTSRGTEGVGGYLVASTSYYDGKLFIVDMFFISALNASTGEVVWKSWLGTELYTTPTCVDGKVYVTTDRRFTYALNSTDGTRLSFFETESNSWSSPSVYEGRVYIGNNDNNLYCLSEYPVIYGQILAELDTYEAEKDGIVTVCGQLSPGIAYVPLTVDLVNPEGEIENLKISAQMDGTFSFTYIPTEIGNWIVNIRCSGSSYIMQDMELSFKVITPQQGSNPTDQTTNGDNQTIDEQDSDTMPDYITVVIVIMIVTAIAVLAFFVVNRRDRSSKVPILNG